MQNCIKKPIQNSVKVEEIEILILIKELDCDIKLALSYIKKTENV